MHLDGQSIAIGGAGRSGLAAARLASARGARVTVLDSGDPDRLAPLRERFPGLDFVFGESATQWRDEAVCQFVLSPGIALENALVAPWVKAGVPVIGEIEFAYRHWQNDIVGITGTNGKTTTTELTTHLLKANGQNAVAGGNYGKPFAEIVLDEPDCEVAVLELSSFQLETIDEFHPHITVWMNFAPDHMDRYRSVEEYRQAKEAIYQRQTGDDHAIVNALNGPLIDLDAQTTTFSAFEKGADFQYQDGQVLFQGHPVIQLGDTHLSGRHNAENLMAALAVGHLRGLPFDQLRQAATDYHPPRHRCERVGTRSDGVLVLNDSKATNVHALESSLRALDGPLVLIAGGKEKGLDYQSLTPWLGEKVAHLITMGEIRQSLAHLGENRCPTTSASSFDEAIAIAFAEARPRQTILFSPGTSSFDMFAGYEQRGDAFCTLAKQHLANHEVQEN